MPVEIKELHIKVAVSSPSDNQPAQAETSESRARFSTSDRERLLAECVEQILQILKEKRER